MSEPTSVYRYYDAFDILIYVGITARGMIRNGEHNQGKAWWPYVTRQEVDHYPTRELASDREITLIRHHSPPFNTQHNIDAVGSRALYLTFREVHPRALTADEVFEATDSHLPLVLSPLTGNVRMRSLPEHFALTSSLMFTPGQIKVESAFGARIGNVLTWERVGPCLEITMQVRRGTEIASGFVKLKRAGKLSRQRFEGTRIKILHVEGETYADFAARRQIGRMDAQARRHAGDPEALAN
jgi:hypothetical protein